MMRKLRGLLYLNIQPLWVIVSLAFLQACQSSDSPKQSVSNPVGSSSQTTGIPSETENPDATSVELEAGSSVPQTGGPDPLPESNPDPGAGEPAGPTFSVTSHSFPDENRVLPISPYGRLANVAMRFSRSEVAAVLLSSGRLLVTGGKFSSALFGTQRYRSFEYLGVGDDFLFSGASRNIEPIPVQHAMAPLPGGKALMLGGSRTDLSGTPAAGSSYDPAIINPDSPDDAGVVTLITPPAAADCGGQTLASQGSVMFEPFSGSISTGTISASDAQWKIGILNSGSSYLWVFDTASATFRCYAYPSISSFDFVRMAALPSGKLFIWSGANSKIFDPSASGGNGELQDVADPAEVTRQYPGLVTLANGKVAVLGGLRDVNTELTSIEVYDPSVDQWTTASATLRKGRYKLFPRLDRNTGEVVIIGGHIKGAGESSVQLGIDAWSPVADALKDTGLSLSLDPWSDFPVPYTTTSGVRNLDSISTAASSVSGSIYWAGDRASGSPKVVGYESGLAPRVVLNTPHGLGPFTVEVLAGTATLIGDSPASYVELEVPIQTQELVRVRLRTAEGATGEFSFSTEVLSPE